MPASASANSYSVTMVFVQSPKVAHADARQALVQPRELLRRGAKDGHALHRDAALVFGTGVGEKLGWHAAFQ